jgi:aminoglycoside 6-adenylyltransferase
MSELDSLLASLVNWGAEETAIRALSLTGSRAFKVAADDLADYDILVFVTTPELYTQSDRWLATFGEVWVAIPDKYEWRGAIIPTRLVIFAGGVKVDFSLIKAELLAELAGSGDLSLGCEVLLDKDGITDKLPKPASGDVRRDRPTEEDFLSLVNEYWFEAYHVAKYLKRDELWLVKFRDWATKTFLLRMIEWHAQAQHHGAYDIQDSGKQMKSWVEGSVWQALHHTFSRFDGDDSWRGLFASMDLFRRLAKETAQALGFTYPDEVDRNITGFILKLKD